MTVTFRRFIFAAAILTFITIVLGGVMRVVENGTCPDWPLCYGQWLPHPVASHALADYLHRAVTALLGAALLAAGSLAWRQRRTSPQVFLAVTASLGLYLAQVVLGWLTLGLAGANPPAFSAAHMGLALVQLAILVKSLVSLYLWEGDQPALSSRLARDRSAWLAYTTLAVFFALLVSGVIVSSTNAAVACPGWPICLPAAPEGWLSFGHRLLVLAVGSLLSIQAVRLWRLRRARTAVLVAATAALVLFLAQALLGARLVESAPVYWLALHQSTSVAAWGALILQLAAGAFAPEQTSPAFAPFGSLKFVLKDLLLLTKPIVVLLLLVTTYAGMVIGGQAWPSAGLVFWTLLGGFMAAGGSGAINQYIDRYDDGKMQRTEKRPIPAGRLTPAEGLAFGVALCIGSFFVLVAYVNLLAGLLSLAGIVYYVLIYSLMLKKTTVQNIVIGGGAGAIPPLVGWAAVTGSLEIPALFLFAVVFLWTPPHFWSLAIVRRKDYARAGVPMLPVVQGETAARGQIFAYTLELVALTLVLPVFGLGSAIYLVSALALGGALVLSAWKVWKQGGNKVAWKMYRYSSMYLAFLFFALMIDRVVLK